MGQERESRPFHRVDAGSEPLELFERWLNEAHGCVEEPTAMALATVGEEGPSVRMVLLKGHDSRGLVFHTHHDSRKAREIAACPQAALAFFWAPLHRQVRVEGTVAQIAPAESDAYFRTRPRGSQIGARASSSPR